MKKLSALVFDCIIFGTLALVATVSSASAGGLYTIGSGANAAAIQTKVDQFRFNLGAINPNTTQTFPAGRREINWDDVPNNFAMPNFMPGNFFNSSSPRGVVFGSPASNAGNDLTNLLVSASAASGTAVRFGNLEPSYATNFQTFSSERLMTVRSSSNNSTVISIQFFIPGTSIPAGVSGFGAILCDVDVNTNALLRLYGVDGHLLIPPVSFTAANNGLSFLGVSFNAGEKIARVEILAGNLPLKAGNLDGVNSADLIAIDDVIYGEPHTIQSHSSDYDGDGTTDPAIFSPSSGIWTINNSGNNTLTTTSFGQSGDIPVNGDFDGDAKTDIAVFRPSAGTWTILKSSNGQSITTSFGVAEDRPVPGDYDKDGKADLAVFRPSTGQWIIMRSSDGLFQIIQHGQNGDIPIPASPQ